MNYEIYKLSFSSPVHFGTGRLSSAADTIYADTLFSALCCEAVNIYGEKGADMLCSLVNDKGLRISDTFPYCGDTLYMPKPIITVTADNDQGDSKLKKKFKKLNYIPVEDIYDYMSGSYIPTDLDLGCEDIFAKVAVNADPYNVGTFTFNNSCGLYFIAMAEDNEAFDILFDLVDSLSYTGIGGKVSSGYGSFKYEAADIPDILRNGFEKEGDIYISLSLSMANDDELDTVIEGASVSLIKRSGFVASSNYVEGSSVRKKDFYCFKAGSCFKKPFNGGIFDVSSVKGGNHRVYKYAAPMLLGIKGGGVVV